MLIYYNDRTVIGPFKAEAENNETVNTALQDCQDDVVACGV